MLLADSDAPSESDEPVNDQLSQSTLRCSRMRHLTRSLILVLCVAVWIPALLDAQDVNVKVGVTDSLRSAVLKETRPLIIYLPPGYETSDKRYPVLYLLDGNRNAMLHAVAVMTTLRSNNSMPEIIVVGIDNIDRDRDMMPLSTKQYQVRNPGAAAFLGFIGDELIPEVDKKYRTDGHRVLSGSSLSGLFVLYALLTKPQLFDSYIGRSAGWLGDMNDYFTAIADNAFRQPEAYNGKVIFMSMSLTDRFDPDKTIHRQMLAFSKRVKKHLGQKVRYDYVTYDRYPHVPFPSLYDGLAFTFQR